jgi:type II secretory pathway component PulL
VDDKFPDEEVFLEKMELAFLNKPFNLLDESFCAESEKLKKRKARRVIICFIGFFLNLIQM